MKAFDFKLHFFETYDTELKKKKNTFLEIKITSKNAINLSCNNLYLYCSHSLISICLYNFKFFLV